MADGPLAWAKGCGGLQDERRVGSTSRTQQVIPISSESEGWGLGAQTLVACGLTSSPRAILAELSSLMRSHRGVSPMASRVTLGPILFESGSQMALYYLSLLDTVNFASTEPAPLVGERSLRVTGSIMLDVLVGLDVPVLSQTQAFDGAMLLNLVSHGGDEAEAVLKLIEQSRIQMRVHAAAERSTAAETFTLKNAFMSALEANFKFSAWPELDDPEARADLLAHLQQRTQKPPSGELGERLEGLLRMDLAFRKSGASEQAIDGAAHIEVRVDDHLKHLGPAGTFLRHLKADVWAWLGNLDSAEQAKYDLTRRSDWYRLLEDYRLRLGWDREHGGIRGLRRVVDLGYNLRVATSLNAQSLGEHEERLDVAAVLRRDDLSTDLQHKAVAFLEADPGRRGLTWASVESRLSERAVGTDTSAGRERRMQDLLNDKCVVEHDQGKLAPVIRIGGKILADVTSVATIGSAGAAVGGAPGAAAGIALGVVINAATDKFGIEKKVADWNIGRLVKASDPAAEVRLPTREPGEGS